MQKLDSLVQLKAKPNGMALLIGAGLILICVALAYKLSLRKLDLVQQLKGKRTIATVIELYGESSRQRMKDGFSRAGVSYPPAQLLLLGLKSEKQLQIYAANEDKQLHFVHSYPILGTSGVLGPKLKEGDKQMPEGFYEIQELEPNSSYHVALRVNYPSPFDKEVGKLDGRTNLGCDIMIHGKDCSIGCLAMGDPASEDLFVLVHDSGLANTSLIMSPYDFRNPPQGVSLPADGPSWLAPLYAKLAERVSGLPAAR